MPARLGRVSVFDQAAKYASSSRPRPFCRSVYPGCHLATKDNSAFVAKFLFKDAASEVQPGLVDIVHFRSVPAIQSREQNFLWQYHI